MADYVFVYFKKGSHLGITPWSGEPELAKTVAQTGLLPRGADEVQIRSNTLDGPLICQEKRKSD